MQKINQKFWEELYYFADHYKSFDDLDLEDKATLASFYIRDEDRLHRSDFLVEGPSANELCSTLLELATDYYETPAKKEELFERVIKSSQENLVRLYEEDLRVLFERERESIDQDRKEEAKSDAILSRWAARGDAYHVI